MTQISEIDYNYNVNPIKNVDVSDPSDIYIGETRNSKNGSANSWQIKRIVKINNVWHTQFPNGDQSHKFKWDNRLTYNYE